VTMAGRVRALFAARSLLIPKLSALHLGPGGVGTSRCGDAGLVRAASLLHALADEVDRPVFARAEAASCRQMRVLTLPQSFTSVSGLDGSAVARARGFFPHPC
jgi:hypothetical protein